MYRAYLDAPNLGILEKKYLTKAIDIGYVSTVGPFVPEFEEAFAKYINSERAVAVQSGTAALHITLYELGVKEDDEVIVPSLTFIATINSVLYVGAKPVIVDVNPKTWNVDPEEIKKAITKKTKAIIPVHLYGNLCDMNTIMEIAKKHNLYVIEDATESLGATYKKKHAGIFGHFGCFSFNGNKLITTGGGGMVVSGNESSIKRIKVLVNQAKKDGAYYHPEMGFNYRMTNLEAALGLAQLKRISEFLGKKKKFNQIYKEILGDLPYIRFQEKHNETEGSWWLTCINIEKNVNIDSLMEKLKEEGIQTRRIFVPACEMPYLKKYSTECPSAYQIYQKGICLPSSTLNSVDTIRQVALILREMLNE